MSLRSHAIFTSLIGLTSLILLTQPSMASENPYKAGTITFKPINVNFTSMTLGLQKKDSNFRTMALKLPESFFFGPTSVPIRKEESAWKAPASFGFQESDSTCIGYGVEGGYMLTQDWELFGRLGYSNQRPDDRFIIGDYSLKFKPRQNWGIGLGTRRYFYMDSLWKPFLGFATGLTFQSATKTRVFAHSPLNDTRTNLDVPMGTRKLYGNKTFYSFECQAGADYVFTDNIAMTIAIAVRYASKGGSAVINLPSTSVPGLPFPIPDRTISYGDNKQRWFIPMTVSLKLTF